MQIVSTWEREEIHLNINEEALIEAGLAQALSVIYLLSHGSHLIKRTKERYGIIYKEAPMG